MNSTKGDKIMLKKILSGELWEAIKRKIYILVKSSADNDTAADDDAEGMVRERGYEPIQPDQETGPDVDDDDEAEEYQPQPWLKSFDEIMRDAKQRPDPQTVQQERQIKVTEEEYEL